MSDKLPGLPSGGNTAYTAVRDTLQINIVLTKQRQEGLVELVTSNTDITYFHRYQTKTTRMENFSLSNNQHMSLTIYRSYVYVTTCDAIRQLFQQMVSHIM